ncbi:MAG: AAA family ATPase, partial [Proteobacteria bacterium]|nr:AAA family ATPase [Pseudomonadota bacterium]
MAKNAEDRYQSTRGIMRDLTECLRQLEQTDHIEDFELAQDDVSEKLQIPQRLYGRETEVASLLDTFSTVAQGEVEYLLVSGFSGVGKSALIQEIHKPIVAQKGYFIDGKFDQFERDVPYKALVQAFQGLVKQLLSEPEESLSNWKNNLQASLGPNGQIIIDLIPEVEKIIGSQSPVQELGPTEAQNRFFITFKNFINLFAQKEHPLVIFLDDLQWSDIPTLKLIEYLLDAPDLESLFLIGAYRDNEVEVGHPLQSSLEEIEKNKTLHKLFLKPLSEAHVTLLVAETVHSDVETVTPLSALIFAKTQGNPFFVNALLKTLYQEEAFNFLADEGRWNWDLDKIEQMDVTDNVVEFMIGQVQKLPPETQRTLQLAACIGNNFDLNTLAMIEELPLTATGKTLLSAINEGIIVPLSDQYRLVHLQEQDRE